MGSGGGWAYQAGCPPPGCQRQAPRPAATAARQPCLQPTRGQSNGAAARAAGHALRPPAQGSWPAWAAGAGTPACGLRARRRGPHSSPRAAPCCWMRPMNRTVCAVFFPHPLQFGDSTRGGEPGGLTTGLPTPGKHRSSTSSSLAATKRAQHPPRKTGETNHQTLPRHTAQASHRPRVRGKTPKKQPQSSGTGTPAAPARHQSHRKAGSAKQATLDKGRPPGAHQQARAGLGTKPPPQGAPISPAGPARTPSPAARHSARPLPSQLTAKQRTGWL
jgi:hypothetical protein